MQSLLVLAGAGRWYWLPGDIRAGEVPASCVRHRVQRGRRQLVPIVMLRPGTTVDSPGVRPALGRMFAAVCLPRRPARAALISARR